MSRPLIPLHQLPEALRPWLDPKTPEAQLQPLLNGTDPLPPLPKICALYQLIHSRPHLSEAGWNAARALPIEVLAEVAQQGIPPQILDWLAEGWAEQAPLALALINNPKTPISTIRHVAGLLDVSGCKILIQSPTLIKNDPKLLQIMGENPALPQLIKDQLFQMYAKIQGHTDHQPDHQSDERSDERSSEVSVEQRSPSIADQPSMGAQPDSINESASINRSVAMDHSVSSASTAERSPLPLTFFNPSLHRFLDPNEGQKGLLFLLKGLAPLSSAESMGVLYQAECMGIESTQSPLNERLTDSDFNTVASDIHTPSTLLSWLCDRAQNTPELAANLALNPSCDSASILRLAQQASREVCERLALNQERLLITPALIEVLYLNPQLRSSTADRMIEFAAREGISLEWLPDRDAVLEAISHHEDGQCTDQDAAFDAAVQEGASEQDDRDALFQSILAARADTNDTTEESDDTPKSGYMYIKSLNVAQKIRLALLGSRMDRSFLIKDSNKVVIRAVIRSPSVSVQEALMYARNASLNAEIIEYIARNRRWMQNYKLRLQVILNPKAPLKIVLPLLNQLRPNDLKSVARSRGVSVAVSRRAKELVKARQG